MSCEKGPFIARNTASPLGQASEARFVAYTLQAKALPICSNFYFLPTPLP
jgi:hypothetical protein